MDRDEVKEVIEAALESRVTVEAYFQEQVTDRQLGSLDLNYVPVSGMYFDFYSSKFFHYIKVRVTEVWGENRYQVKVKCEVLEELKI